MSMWVKWILDEMTIWWNYQFMKWSFAQIDEWCVGRWNDYLTKYLFDETTFWWNGSLDEMTFRWTDSLLKWPVNEIKNKLNYHSMQLLVNEIIYC
jgi:hypothetical protein